MGGKSKYVVHTIEAKVEIVLLCFAGLAGLTFPIVTATSRPSIFPGGTVPRLFFIPLEGQPASPGLKAPGAFCPHFLPTCTDPHRQPFQ